MDTAPNRRDFTQVAFDVVQRATGEVTAPVPTKRQESGRKVQAKTTKPAKKTPPAR